MLEYHSIYGVDEICWFEKGKSGIALVRPSGSRRRNKLKPAANYYKSKEAADGWKRAILFMKEFNIWDGTAFACTMDTALCFVDKNDEVLLFVTPQMLDRIPVEILPDYKRKLVSENLASFYSDPNLQAKMFELILHGMTFCFNGTTLEPISVKEAVEHDLNSNNRIYFSAACISSAKELRDEISSLCDIHFPQPNSTDGKIYHIKRERYEAIGESRGKKFAIFKGSTINPDISGVMPKAAVDAREACIENGILDENLKLVRDIELSSSSAAAAFVVGHTVSGPMTWRDEDGKTMKEPF